jgi:hypothetical protein
MSVSHRTEGSWLVHSLLEVVLSWLSSLHLYQMLLVGVFMTPSHGGKFPQNQSSRQGRQRVGIFGKGLVKMSLIHRRGQKKGPKNAKNAQKSSRKCPDRLFRVRY